MRDIESNIAVFIETMSTEGVPFLQIEWITVGVEIGEYTFYFNGDNRYHDLSEYKVRLTMKAKILCILNIN